MTQLQVDFDSGLPDGYTGKIECGVRMLGNLSMDCLLGALGVEIVVVERETPETHDKSA